MGTIAPAGWEDIRPAQLTHKGADPSSFQYTDTYDTVLSPEEEQAFQQWKLIYAPRDSGQDYDLRGAFKAGLKSDPTTGHWSDLFKKPNHPTFSVESKYAKDHPEMAGRWEGDKYIPPSQVGKEQKKP